MNWPSRVKRSPCAVRTAKKPSPAIAKSSGWPVSRSGPGDRSVTTLSTATPSPSEPIGAPLEALLKRSAPKLDWRARSGL